MTISPDYSREVARRVRAHYQDAEDIVLERLVEAVARGLDDDSWAHRKAGDLTTVLGTIDRQLARMDEAAPALIEKAIAEAWQAGETAAGAEMTAAGLEAIGGRGASRGVDVLAEDTVRVLGDMRPRVVRAAADVYQRVTADTAAQVLTGAQTRRAAARSAVRSYAAEGIAPFVDEGGRRWEMGAYAEMTTRTTAGQAAIAGHTDRLQALGQDLVIVSSSPESCDLCGPWEGKVLSISGDSRGKASDGTRIAGTISRARGAGLQHPNAILGGDQAAEVLGDLQNAARSWYDGPSIHLTTARGHRLTVSPNHPVLTSAGWRRADAVREGDQVFSRPGSERVDAAAVPVEDLNDVPSTFQQVFDALAAHGLRTSVTPTADDFHGDGRHYEGDVDVVWSEGALLDVSQADVVQELDEFVLMGTGVEAQPLAGLCSRHAGSHGVGGPVGGALPHLDSRGAQAAQHRLPADAEDPGEVLRGLACGVSADQVVKVERDWFRGHCFDLQTSTGAYLTGAIVVHNCTHTVGLFLPGTTPTPKVERDPEAHKIRQKQRQKERAIRRDKRAVLIDEETMGKDSAEAIKSRQRLRTRRAEFKAWREDNDRKNLSYRTNLESR